jgi:hypothetical protein
MKLLRVKNPDGNGFYNIVEFEDFEYSNPIEKDLENRILFELANIKNLVALKTELIEPFNGVIDTEKVMARMALKQGTISFQEELERLQSIELPQNLLNILGNTKKKQQEKILKNISLTSSQLTSLIYTAHSRFGYTYSMYTAHTYPNVDPRQLPAFAYISEEGKLITSGQTRLTNGQIRSAIEQRQTSIAKFLDNGPVWHCFFYTYRSLAGKETGGNAHIHYLSHNWSNLKREDILNQIKSGKYKLPRAPHIPFERHK